MSPVYHVSPLNQLAAKPRIKPIRRNVPAMAYDPGAIDATLAAAVGDEPQLIAELREAFLESAKRCLEALRKADSPDHWQAAALRLKGLAASFGAVRLMALAGEAANGPEHDAPMLRKLHRAVERL
jgi:histidine phosphotransfer protein HptB